MGKITVFSLDTCPFCKKAKELLASKGVSFDVISLTQQPEWRPLMYLLTKGRYIVYLVLPILNSLCMYSAYAIKENASTHYTSYTSWICPIILGRTSVPEVRCSSTLSWLVGWMIWQPSRTRGDWTGWSRRVWRDLLSRQTSLRSLGNQPPRNSYRYLAMIGAATRFSFSSHSTISPLSPSLFPTVPHSSSFLSH